MVQKKAKSPSDCTVCGAPIGQPAGRGRKRSTCSDACRMKQYRQRRQRRGSGRR